MRITHRIIGGYNSSCQLRKCTHIIIPYNQMFTNDRHPKNFDGLYAILSILRGPCGCSWDKDQTRNSLKIDFLEECYELIEAIEDDRTQGIVEELGDLLLHIGLQIRIGEEQGEFTRQRVFEELIDKLLRRHPHIFDKPESLTSSEAESQWDDIKKTELIRDKNSGSSILDGLPVSMPALGYAQAVQKRASRLGFDWDNIEGVLENIIEEIREFKLSKSLTDKEHELGDILFSLVNFARWINIDAESMLRKASARFYRRFTFVEKTLKERRLALKELNMEDKGALWQEAKDKMG